MNATDTHTVSLRQLTHYANICAGSICNAQKNGVLAAGKTRKGVHGKWWTAAEANKFLKRRGHNGPWFE